MSAIVFKCHGLGYVGDMSEIDADPRWAAIRWHRYCADYLPQAPLGGIRGFSGLMVDEDYDQDLLVCHDEFYRIARDLQDRLTYMLTNPTAELRFDPGCGFLFNSEDDMIFKLSRP